MSHSKKRRGHWSFVGGFREAIWDPSVRLLLGLTAIVILAGAIFYMVAEGWSFLDSLYFATVTISTVGYGDFAPETVFGRLFTVVYIVMGIGLFLALASAFADHLIDRAQRNHGGSKHGHDPES
ncbi:potassium channel family protein [Tropicimonas sp. TH_r6]|uniref:potassium channel family protein n=1 Tax=Tropicimonas sp. TH_r6 TaxID=3082085 RepID=UPI002953E3A2|nr:potassium channel family protein [Tropicimonas sp. TH_r6]MDV7142760.1 potassium channel family protein [Tropicimonas sp. TH_r6]